MFQFGLIGFPLSHSFSKKYFTQKFVDAGLQDYVYDNFELPSIEALSSMMQNNPYLKGFNITIPYKKQIVPLLHNMTDDVVAMQASNCVKIVNGQLTGHNTDVIGFEKSLMQKLQTHHQAALILGTGGAASAVQFVLRKLGITYLSVSSSQQTGSIGYNELTQEIVTSHLLIINTTPLGTFPNIEHAPDIPYHLLTEKHFLFDLVYNPPKTLFLQRGEDHGAIIQNGYDMLVYQAEASWDIWNG
jgi:shikimate dehydrogenase